MNCDIPSDHPPNIRTLPPEIRALIYDRLIPHGPQITLRLHTHTTKLNHLYILSQTCRALHTEITSYLALRPLTILCTNDLTPNILNDIPPRILAQVETLAIEGDGQHAAGPEPNWRLLPNITTICFTEIFDIHNIQPHSITTQPSSTSQPPSPFQPSLHNTRTHTMTPTYPPTRASLPTNNTVLSHAHRYWQDLRLHNQWVMALWKRADPPFDTMRHVRVILRRVFEGHVSFTPETPYPCPTPPLTTSIPTSTPTPTPNAPSVVGDALPLPLPPPQPLQEEAESATVTYHAVVDVDSRKVLENRYLGTRIVSREDAKKSWEQEQEETMFAYAAQTWWRREMVGVRER